MTNNTYNPGSQDKNQNHGYRDVNENNQVIDRAKISVDKKTEQAKINIDKALNQLDNVSFDFDNHIVKANNYSFDYGFFRHALDVYSKGLVTVAEQGIMAVEDLYSAFKSLAAGQILDSSKHVADSAYHAIVSGGAYYVNSHINEIQTSFEAFSGISHDNVNMVMENLEYVSGGLAVLGAIDLYTQA